MERPSLVPELRLHLANEIITLWRMTQEKCDDTDAPPPFWAFAWPGGQAIARYVLDHPQEVAGKRVLDFATGSGVCAIACLKAGASRALAVDTDVVSEHAVALNARVNGVRVSFSSHDLLCADPPEIDVILAGDVCYEHAMTPSVLGWLRKAHDHGTRVLIGDPGRAYFPIENVVRLATYEVQTSRDLEDTEVKRTGVYTFPSGETG